MKLSFSEFEAVLAVARHGGFRAAARSLGQTSSSLSHAVAGLENRLAIKLFNRTTRSVSLTAAGQHFVNGIGPALQSIERTIDELGAEASEPSGTLRINTSLGAARMMMEPIVLAYSRRYPKVALEVVTDDAFLDLADVSFDAGTRLADAVPSDMIAVPIFPLLRMIVVGAPAYFEEHPRPLSPPDLSRHRCINHRMANGRLYRWEFERHGQDMTVDVAGKLIFDATELALSAALAGVGLAYVEEGMAQPHIEAGRLVNVLGGWTPAFPGLSLYFSGRRNIPLKLRALIDLIRERHADRPVGLPGRNPAIHPISDGPTS